jgi:hypothetical protein
VEVTYSSSKDRENLRKHGISLRLAEDFDVDTALFAVDDSQDYGEIRYNAIGWIDAQLYTFTFRQDEDSIRAISLRKATREERRRYDEAL